MVRRVIKKGGPFSAFGGVDGQGFSGCAGGYLEGFPF
jgi:hypothetical protein